MLVEYIVIYVYNFFKDFFYNFKIMFSNFKNNDLHVVARALMQIFESIVIIDMHVI
jgi:hypothetical protein